ncbi:unnamed protein product, partial [marine sediment metagenome]
MRILMISQHYEARASGYALQCMDAACGLVERGHRVCVATSLPRGRRVDRGVEVRGVLRCREVVEYQTPSLCHVVRYLRDERVFRKNGAAVAAVARAFVPDVVFFWQFWELGPQVVQRLAARGLPLVLNVGDIF